MVYIIKSILQQLINDIDAGNSVLTEEEQVKVLNCLQDIVSTRLSKEQACKYLKVSRATFDNLVRAGKLPKGIKEVGFKELSWKKSALDKYIANAK